MVMLNLNRFPLPKLVIGSALVSTFLAVLLAAPPEGAQDGEFHGQPALVMANDKLELKVLSFGGALASLKLKGDGEKMNPLRAVLLGTSFAWMGSDLCRGRSERRGCRDTARLILCLG